ncbi:MAG: hypothetical protein LBR52_04620 [Prevotellaceae bacterium]|jgi:hypothetical protein|nr:hypothetical protein [Prevotellaceae bacterium]
MKSRSFLLLVSACFLSASCSFKYEKKLPPDITGTWSAVTSDTYNLSAEGEIYNDSYYTFWEGEKTLILYDDNVWEEINGTVSYSGTWEIYSVSSSDFDWELALKQPTASKYFFVQRIYRNELILEEQINSWHRITRYVKIPGR